MTLALTPSGLSTQTQQEIVDELVQKLRATFGNNLNTSVESIMGQLVNIFSELRALDQQTLLAVYRAFDPNSALGVALDRLANLTGSVRKGATFSQVNGLVTFSAAGTWSNGDLLQNDDNLTTWQVINGPYTDTGGPYPEDVVATVRASVAGPTLANALTNWSLITLPAGVLGFANATDDANVGSLQETDPAFRVRRQIELFSRNQGPLAAIRGVVSKVDGVTAVRVIHNPATSPVDSDSVPFKAFNVIVETNPTPPGATLAQDIADAIFSAMGAGGEAFGTGFTEVVTDDEGEPQPVNFDIVTNPDVFIKITLDTTGTEEVISNNLATVVAAAILEAAQKFYDGIGRDQHAFEYVGVVNNLKLAGKISGVVTVVAELSLVSTAGPFFDPLPIGTRERPDFDSVNILVVVTP